MARSAQRRRPPHNWAAPVTLFDGINPTRVSQAERAGPPSSQSLAGSACASSSSTAGPPTARGEVITSCVHLGMPRSLPFVYAAEELADALAERMSPVLGAAELTAAQFNVLYMLIEDGPMRLSALAEHRRCVKSNISYLTRAMLREGLVELSASHDDGRARVLSASKLGQRRYGVARAAAQKIEHALRSALGAEATDKLARACVEAAAALDAL